MPCPTGKEDLIFWNIPDKVKEIYYAIRRDHPEYPKELAVRIAWSKYKGKEGPPYSAPLTRYPKKTTKHASDSSVLRRALAAIKLVEQSPLKRKEAMLGRTLGILRRAGVPIDEIKMIMKKRKAAGTHRFVRALRRYLQAKLVELRK